MPFGIDPISPDVEVLVEETGEDFLEDNPQASIREPENKIIYTLQVKALRESAAKRKAKNWARRKHTKIRGVMTAGVIFPDKFADEEIEGIGMRDTFHVNIIVETR